MAFTQRSVQRPADDAWSGDATPEQSAPTPLHVLLLEDSAADAALIVDELRQGGYAPVARRVATRGAMLEALQDSSWQIVFLDYRLEGGETAMDALASLDELELDIPAILISGVIGEEAAVDVLRAGARDYVSKGNLTRLVPAVARELAQADARCRWLQGEEALRQSEQRLRLALVAGGMGTWEWDLLSDQLYWSEKLEQMFGLDAGKFGGSYTDFIELIHPDDRELVRASIQQTLQHDGPAVVYRARWPDGTIRWHERKTQRVRDADGRAQVLAGVTFDVTEREEAARALRESEERFRLIAEHAHDLIALLDAEGRYRYLSPSCQVILGYPPEALLGTLAAALIHRDDSPNDWIWGPSKPREARMRRVDGTWLWVEGLSYEITGQAESHFAVILRDISERKREEIARELLEDELRQAQKMEAFGQLAGGIAHDFNNLLTVINGYTEIILRRLGREAAGSTEIAEVGKAAARAAQLTGQLLAYSRKQVLQPTVLDLNDVVIETQTMLRRLISEDIEFTTSLADDLGHINADDGQVGQIVMNLVVNARDAMPDGGKLVLATDKITLPSGAVRGHPEAPPGDYVVLAVTDTGHGMDAARVRRIFEPYYTTKERGAGTGLGLSTVYGIVKQSNGHIEVESEPGVGTTFRIYFPLVSEVVPELEPLSPRAPDGRSLQGSETILLVEDDDALRRVGKEILESYGYTVLLAGNGIAGLELARDHPAPIDVLMTDILMPKMGGIELSEQLATLRPELRVLYTSGYNDSGSSLQRIEGARYLQKPYGMENLARAVRDLLESTRPSESEQAASTALR